MDFDHINNSAVYEDDFENIENELKCDTELEKLEEIGESGEELKKKFSLLMKGYEKKCLARIKTLLNENGENKEKIN